MSGYDVFLFLGYFCLTSLKEVYFEGLSGVENPWGDEETRLALCLHVGLLFLSWFRLQWSHERQYEYDGANRVF